MSERQPTNKICGRYSAAKDRSGAGPIDCAPNMNAELIRERTVCPSSNKSEPRIGPESSYEARVQKERSCLASSNK